MQTIKFIIRPFGDIPAFRSKVKLTKAQRWTKKAQDYANYKAHVQRTFIESLKPEQQAVAKMNMVNTQTTARQGKPVVVNLQAGQIMHMDTTFVFTSRKHPDPENIFGAIADALFFNDNQLSGSFQHSYGTKKDVPMAIVTLTLPDGTL